MAEAKLRDGDVEEAKQLLAEYRSHFPARSAGMLPGLILMAEKRYGEAETFFASLASGASDPGVACAAELGIGEARLRQKNYKGALEKFRADRKRKRGFAAVGQTRSRGAHFHIARIPAT